MVGLGPTGSSDNPDNPIFMFVCRRRVTVRATSRGNRSWQSGLSKNGSRGKLKYLSRRMLQMFTSLSNLKNLCWIIFSMFHVCRLLTSVIVDVDG